MPKKLWVTSHKPRPFWGMLFTCTRRVRLAFRMRSCGPNLKSLAQIVLDILDNLPENLGVTWPRPRPFSWKFFSVPARLSQDKVTHQIWSL